MLYLEFKGIRFLYISSIFLTENTACMQSKGSADWKCRCIPGYFKKGSSCITGNYGETCLNDIFI